MNAESFARDLCASIESKPLPPPDWLRLVAIWAWVRSRPHATFDEFLAALPTIDRFAVTGETNG